MAPRQSAPMSNLNSIRLAIQNGSQTARTSALGDLIEFFHSNSDRQAELISANDDGNLHKLIEAIFHCTLSEKQAYYSISKKTAKPASATRLSKCAEALRTILEKAGSKLKRKTIRATVDHITQTLPGPEGTFVDPLIQDYVKAFRALLDRPSIVELVAAVEKDTWLTCVDFASDCLSHYFASGEQESEGFRQSPLTSTGRHGSLLPSTGRSSRSLIHHAAGQMQWRHVEDILASILSLVSATNAPTHLRAKEISNGALQVLQLRHRSAGQSQQIAIATLTEVFLHIQIENVALSKLIAKDVVPMLGHWWQSRGGLARDAFTHSLRDEILRLLFAVQLHLEALAREAHDETFSSNLEDLLDVIWQEYSKREERGKLQLDDLSFSDSDPIAALPSTTVFHMRPNHVPGEQRWATVQVLAFLESIFALIARQRILPADEEEEGLPRKRRRLDRGSDRLHDQLTSLDPGVRLTALQLVPFLSQTEGTLQANPLQILDTVSAMISDKQSLVASWAMLACISCIPVTAEVKVQPTVWRQVWQITARLISTPATSRAASALLHAILEADIIPYNEIADDLNGIVTSAEISGPALLVDSSLSLMLHILSVRAEKLPNGSESTAKRIIGWLFARWTPAELLWASQDSRHANPVDIANLLCSCCEHPLPESPGRPRIYGGLLHQSWTAFSSSIGTLEYALLLPSRVDLEKSPLSCIPAQQSGSRSPVDASGSHAARKLVLDLLSSKVEDLTRIAETWSKRSGDGGSQISADRLRSLVDVCLTGNLVMPMLLDLSSSVTRGVESAIVSLLGLALRAATEAGKRSELMQTVLLGVGPLLPQMSIASIETLTRTESRHLLGTMVMLSDAIRQTEVRGQRFDEEDVMDMDDEFDMNTARNGSTARMAGIPQRDNFLRLTQEAFLQDTILRLHLIAALNGEESQVGLIPPSFTDELVGLAPANFLLCSGFMKELFQSDFIVSADDALAVVQTIGDIVAEPEYQYCEALWCIAVDIMEGLVSLWTDETLRVSGLVGDLYVFLVKRSLPGDWLSPRCQAWFARLLFKLLAVKPTYGTSLEQESCKTTLFAILNKSLLAVKYSIAMKLQEIFGFYVLKNHDDIFVDILDNLPADPDYAEGIAFRMLALTELACKWPTLLRRCVYHIFETPGRISQSAGFASGCLRRISMSLSLSSPQELFSLFSPQLLYTWLEEESIDDIPYTIFGYATLLDLLKQIKTEAVAIMMMRGQDEAAAGLAKKLGSSLTDLLGASFPKVLAYTVAHDISVPTAVGQVSGENRLRRLLGKETFLEAIYLNFAEIVAVFLGSFDQESALENYWKKEAGLAEAARAMEEIKSYGHLDVQLPPDQQPTFKGKFLTRQIEHLCSRTDYELVSLWTPAFVAFQSRKLLNSAHPAFGPLHACSVLRKLRVLICLSGRQALADYPLEMLLSSMRAFISDPECADDALGISRYLITHGDLYLKGVPTFTAGYGLSTLADLRVFLESSQSSTTQESQFKATKSKAQVFHTWLTGYLTAYESTAFTGDQQRMAFGSIIQAAAHIRASGNAEKGTNESNLLLEILKDGTQEKPLLSQSARDVALAMLCGRFQIPRSADMDVIDSDDMALKFSTMVWRTCEATGLSPDYLSWAGRAIGRSFAASGNIDNRLVREVSPEQFSKSVEEEGSEPALLRLLERLSSTENHQTAGLAEAALRVIVSDAELRQDSHLLAVAQQTISDALYASCSWSPYGTAPSDQAIVATLDEGQIFDGSWLESPRFAETLATHAAQSVSTETLLVGVLPGILANVKEFAEQSFPYIIHLALLHQADKQQGLKKQLSTAFQQWLSWTVPTSMANLKLLIRTILYLRSQPLPNEKSIADRAGWLDVSYADAAAAASRCGLFKIALLFSEIAFSETGRSSRRSSAGQHLEDWTDVLLKVFENLDDPDTRYGLPQEPSLDSVLTRVQYEKDGQKTLAFMGAQFDSHLRLGDSASDQDSKSLVKALSSLGLAGLSYSLRQTQQIADTSSAEVTDTFNSSRRIEKWNLPVAVGYSNDSVTLYKTYQTIHNAAEMSVVRKSIYDALGQTVQHVVTQSLSAPGLRRQLATLAALTELDDVLSVSDAPDLDNVLHKFDARSKWMMSGRYDDVSQILSTRETTLSMLSQKSLLRNATKLSAGEARLGHVRAMLLSSDIFRFHHEHQESLNIATSLSHLVDPSREIGLVIDVAVRMEVAHALWDHDETITSIRMLQSIDGDIANLKKQTLPISRSELLSRLAHQVSVARLESADTIQKRYLEPALKELRGSSSGKEAGQVYHQFARFCDEQLQNPDSLKDLERLQGLKKGKSEEVQQLKSLIASAKDSQHRQRYTGHLSRAKQWLDLDQQEVRRVEQTRSEFLRLSLENYLLSLAASDEHNNDALRFTALWLERSGEDITNEAVKRYLDAVPTRKFAPLMNQLSSRVQNQSITFQKLLMTLVYRICVDHPYHGMYQIWSGVKTRVNEKDEVAVLRQKATEKISQQLAKTSSVAATWAAIDKTSIRYHALAVDRDQSRYKAGQKAQLKDSVAGQNLMTYLTRYPIPPPTLQIELAADMDYSRVPNVAQLDPTMTIASGVSAPKIITAIGTDGQRYKQLVKGGNDDLRQDAIMEQVFAAVSELLKLHRDTRQRSLGIRTYKVLPLTASSGLIEFVSDTIPLHEYLMPAHERYYPKDLKGSQCRKEISGVQTKSVETRIETYRRVAQRFHPVMRFFFMEYFVDPDEWFAKRTNYTRTTAAISILGHILGLGDRHGHNILLDSKNGEVVHIDLGVAFEMGRVLPVPELVPFRLTRDIVDGMGITKTEGVFRRCCEFTLDALREEAYSIMTILDVLRYDPLYTWSISPVRLAKLQNQRQNADENETGTDGAGGEPSALGGIGSRRGEGVATTTSRPEKSEADRALELVSKKLSKTLSVTATVNDLINQATDERNLAVLYSGWAAYA